MERHAQNGLAVAEHLSQHDAVEWVYYPGLPSSPYHEVADRVLAGIEAACLRLADLPHRGHVPRELRDIGIAERLRDLRNPPRRDQLRDFSEKAAVIKRILRVNPRPVSVPEIAGIFEQAF